MAQTTKTNKQPKLFSIYKFQPDGGLIHTSYKMGYSKTQILKQYPHYNNKNTLVCEA